MTFPEPLLRLKFKEAVTRDKVFDAWLEAWEKPCGTGAHTGAHMGFVRRIR